MGKLLKRILSLLVVFVICFSAFPVSASAADGVSFWDYITGVYAQNNIGDALSAWWGNIIGSSDPATAESDYVTDLDTELGTCTVFDGGIRLYFLPSSVSFLRCSEVNHSFGSTSLLTALTYDDVSNGRQLSLIYSDPLFIPFAGTGTFHYSVTLPAGFTFNSSYFKVSTHGFTQGLSVYPSAAGDAYPLSVTASGTAVTGTTLALQVSYWLDFVPSSGTLSDNTGVDVSADTRAGALTGDLMYVGDDGQQIVADDVTLFDESTGTAYNPSTNDSYNVTDWSYDYSTRTYDYSTDDGHTGKVVYGDDNASVTLTDSDGNVITYNYYYTVSGTSDSTDSSTSIWDKLGDLIGTAIDGLLSLVTTALSHLLDSLISLLEMINGKLSTVLNTVFSLFDHIPSLFNGFTAFLAAVFPFIPQDIWDVLELGVCLLAAAVLIRFFLKR